MRGTPIRSTLAALAILAPASAPATIGRHPASASARDDALKVGDLGPRVEALQRTLNARLSPSPNLGVDGDFGKGTREALIRFQKSAGLAPTGVADGATMAALGPIVPPEGVPPPEVVDADVRPKAPADDPAGPPFVSAKAWAILDASTGARLAGGNDESPVDMASTTKIMTALVVLDRAKADPKLLDEVVTFSERADGTPGSTAGVHAGEALPARELLYGLLLPSGNDAATAFAEHCGRSMGPGDPYGQFIDAMNRKAAELGLRSAHFANPHGLTAAGHAISALDLARLARVALDDPSFAKVVSTRSHGWTLEGPAGRRNVAWKNTNHLLDVDGYDGVKTGTTDAAGYCLVAAGHRGGSRLVVAVLGATTGEGRYADARNLFRWGFARVGAGR